jgi:hypothetical protein
MSIIVNNTDNQLNINNNGVLDVYAVRSIKSVSKAVDASGNYYIAINFIANDKNNSLRIYLKDVSSPVTWTNDLTGANAALADIRDWLSEVIDVEISEANDSILVYGFDGTNNQPIKTDTNGVLAIQDNGGSITVDGTVSLSAGSLSALESITVQNPGGASAVNIQDGGNSITVDGTVAATQSGTWSVGVTNAAGASAVNIQDGGNSITVDGGTGLLRTTGMIRPTGSGNVNTASATFYSVSVANVGAANGTVLASLTTIKPGEVLNFSADAINNYFNSFAYNATGTEFIIIYVA